MTSDWEGEAERGLRQAVKDMKADHESALKKLRVRLRKSQDETKELQAELDLLKGRVVPMVRHQAQG